MDLIRLRKTIIAVIYLFIDSCLCTSDVFHEFHNVRRKLFIYKLEYIRILKLSRGFGIISSYISTN